MLAAELFFGRNIPGGRRSAKPNGRFRGSGDHANFPDGFTVFDGALGQSRDRKAA